MNQDVLNFIKEKRVGVIALEMLDGSPHAATVHYANTDDPLMFFFETDPQYRKAGPLVGRELSRASLVIGSDESDMRTLQIDGQARVIKAEEKALFDEIYYGKFPEKLAKFANREMVFFALIPTWWRYTDWTRPEGNLILSSEDK